MPDNSSPVLDAPVLRLVGNTQRRVLLLRVRQRERDNRQPGPVSTRHTTRQVRRPQADDVGPGRLLLQDDQLHVPAGPLVRRASGHLETAGPRWPRLERVVLGAKRVRAADEYLRCDADACAARHASVRYVVRYELFTPLNFDHLTSQLWTMDTKIVDFPCPFII